MIVLIAIVVKLLLLLLLLFISFIVVVVVVLVVVVVHLNQGYPALLTIDINRHCPEDRNHNMSLTFI